MLRNDTEGVIDATVYQFPNGTAYLIYKIDGNAHGKPTELYAIELARDGRSVVGPHHFLFQNTLSWERGIVEAPWVVKEG